MIPAETYVQRRKRLMSLVNHGLLIIPPHPHLTYSNDKHVKYRPNSNTVYFSGVKQRETTIILDLSEYKTFLFLLDVDKEKEQWEGKRLEHRKAGERSGIQLVYPVSEFESKLRDLLERTNVVYYPKGVNTSLFDRLVHITENLEKEIDFQDPTPRIDVLRLIKDQEEFDLIQESMQLTIDGHFEAIKNTRIGMAEYEIEAIYANYFRVNGGILPTFQAIVASGENTTILHHHASGRKLQEGDLVLVDTGCEYNNYTSDVARTWPVSGKFTKEQAEIYQIVLKTHQTCLDMVQPGVKFWDIHEKAIEILSQGLIDLGIYQSELDTLIEEEIYKEFFMHGIGHFLGLDGHDTSTIDRTEVTLQPGMYITIEPGIYLSKRLDIPPEYKGIGIRIEDNVLVTREGGDVLSGELPVELEEIEQLVGSALNIT